MIAPTLALLLGLGPALGGPRSAVSASARTELRVREGEGAQSGPGDTSGWDFDNLATAGVAFDWRRTRLTLIYAPRLVFTDFTQSDASSDLMHGADLALTFQGRSTTLVLSQHGEYGHRRFTALARADVDAITGMPITNTTPASESVLFAASVTQAALQLSLSQRSNLGFAANYGVSGGVDDESRRILPLVAGPHLEMTWTYGVSARDTFGLALAGTYLHAIGPRETADQEPDIEPLVPAVDTGAIVFTQRWDHLFRRELRGSLSVGEAVLFEEGRKAQFLPQGFATLTRSFAGGSEHGVLEASVGAGTAIDTDRVTGRARPTVRATAQVAWTAYPFRTYVLGGALKTIGAATGNEAATVFNAEIGASYHLLHPLALELGARMTDQDIEAPETASAAAAPTGFAAAAFIALSWRPEPWPL
ncbi:MAG TPA: hypothetical protein VG937_25525 [Polyangiaceae bacterium]|nr:hypothetical protein [Polyangiaceae bacterium]